MRGQSEKSQTELSWYQLESWPEIIILSLWTDPNDMDHHPTTECALGNAFKHF